MAYEQDDFAHADPRMFFRRFARHEFPSWHLFRAERAKGAGVRVTLKAGSTPRADVIVAHPSAELFGSDRMMVETVRGLTEAGRRVLVALPENGPLVDRVLRTGAGVVIVPMLVLRKSLLRPSGWGSLVGRSVRGAVAIVRTLSRHRKAMVYVSTITIPQWPVFGWLFGRRVVTHVHEAEASARPIVNRALYLPHHCAHRLIVNSEFSLRTMLGAAPRLKPKSSVVLNGVEGPSRTSAPRVRPDILEVLYLGRLSERKGPDLLIPAALEAQRRGVPIRLTFLGSVFTGYEWYEDGLREQASAAPFANPPVFVGFEPSVWDRVDAADIVVVPSRVDEPFGNTVIEAVLSRRPVIVSETSGLREAAAGYASTVWFAPGDAASLADALEQSWRDWPSLSAATADSANLARERHAPAQYRRAVSDIALGRHRADSPTTYNRSDDTRAGVHRPRGVVRGRGQA